MKESINEASLSTEVILNDNDMEENEEGGILRNAENKSEVNEEVQIEQDKVKMSLVNLSLSFTNAADVLRTTDIKDSDNFELVKFQIRVRAVYIYKWTVYHRPADIKKNYY